MLDAKAPLIPAVLHPPPGDCPHLHLDPFGLSGWGRGSRAAPVAMGDGAVRVLSVFISRQLEMKKLESLDFTECAIYGVRTLIVSSETRTPGRYG